ncbi:hypothetical protein [Peteryoungia ipomoeae]|uniref:Uncharacterized protein n=1 Tax=Peteryoungia ipomoeae TaxID=1210932 RepID=A0A4S8NRJ9_9HYPH|nr:hypothetical protein [Peteryoungia ipomoeae]THV18069.1 hypothetical protein FAA97_20915 [Peteryoungia ipomoeae]
MRRAETGSARQALSAVALEETGRQMAALLTAMLSERVAVRRAARDLEAAEDGRLEGLRREAGPGGEK